MAEDWLTALPPVQGCLYCHSEGAVSVEAGRGRLPRTDSATLLKCSHCGSVAELEAGPGDPQGSWRIRYRKVNQAPRYYFVARRFGAGDWLDRAQALQASTNGYVQRQRVRQTAEGDLSWLAPLALDPAPPFIVEGETVFLDLRAVTLSVLAPQTWIFRSGQDELLDSGKLYVTDRKLHLLGQRRDWSVSWADVLDSGYDAEHWHIRAAGDERTRRFSAQRLSNEMDPQLIVTIVEHLRQEG